MGLLSAGLLFAVGLVAISLQTDYIADLLVERSSVTMDYDTGEEGRFGGQEKAIGLIADNPLGIGAQQFVTHHHPEEVHNVYLNMLLNAGWLGGGVYWILVALTVVLGFRHALKCDADAAAVPHRLRGLRRCGARGRDHRHRPLAPFLPADGRDLGPDVRANQRTTPAPAARRAPRRAPARRAPDAADAALQRARVSVRRPPARRILRHPGRRAAVTMRESP